MVCTPPPPSLPIHSEFQWSDWSVFLFCFLLWVEVGCPPVVLSDYLAKVLALKAQFKCFTHRVTLINESHHLSQLSRNCFSIEEEESLPNRQLRVLLMYAIEFHSWWLRHRYKETHSHRLWCTACTCGEYFIDDLCLLINLCLFFTHTHTHIETQIQINHLWVFPLWFT